MGNRVRCEICDKPCDAASRVELSPQEWRDAAGGGLDPFLVCEAPLRTPGKSKDSNLRVWRKEVASRKEKWAVCPICRVRMNEFLEPAPEPSPEARRADD